MMDGVESTGGEGGDNDGAANIKMRTISFAERKKTKFTLIPPPTDISDPLAIVDIGRSAESLILVLPGGEDSIPVDEDGAAALTILRSLGLPPVTALVQLPLNKNDGNSNSGWSLKDRSAAKKRATAALEEHIPLGNQHHNQRAYLAETESDIKAVLRHFADSTLALPHWRRHRPSVLAEHAAFVPSVSEPGKGTLKVTGYVRVLGLGVHGVVHIPGAGDFQLDQIDSAKVPYNNIGEEGGANMDVDGTITGRILAIADPASREGLQRENELDHLAGEQTWPTDAEIAEAEQAFKSGKAKKKRRLPEGTSDYQAAWIVEGDDDDDFYRTSDEENEEGDNDDDGMPGLDLIDGTGNGTGNDKYGGGDFMTDADGLDLLLRNAEAGTEFGMDMEDDEEEEISNAAAAAAKQKYRAEADDVIFPDEVETPADVQARQRFGKYRGLKSFRTSKWDAKESLPLEYARVYAFENPKRTEKRAKAAALRAGFKVVKKNLTSMDVDNVDNGTTNGTSIIGGVAGIGDYVCLHIANVPEDVAMELVARVNANSASPPLTITGLLQHETKLSVVNFGIRKSASYTPPLSNKESLLFITGVRGFFTRPVFSSDEHGADKFKMERFLHQGHAAIASVYAPISYGPLPLLAFRLPFDGGKPVLVATGALRNCDPDRIVLKKIVLSGYPVKVHKMKAVVKFMFHSPEDIKWFQPVDLWTKHGRRGRIKEPIGTHGAMKCIFDGGVKQQDAVCMSLFKRVYPKWPEDMRFADI